MIVDYRCPECNYPVRGRQEVICRKTPPPKSCTCPQCGAPVKLASTTEDAFTDGKSPIPMKVYYYTKA
jgi:hypothetical protein